MRTGHLTTQHELGMLWCATRGCARVMARVRLNAHTAPDNATQAGYAMLQAQAAPRLTHTLTKVPKVFDHFIRRSELGQPARRQPAGRAAAGRGAPCGESEAASIVIFSRWSSPCALGSRQCAQQLGAGAPGLELAASAGGRGRGQKMQQSVGSLGILRLLYYLSARSRGEYGEGWGWGASRCLVRGTLLLSKGTQPK